MGKVTIIIEDYDGDGGLRVKCTFDPSVEKPGEKFSLAQSLGILCVEGIKDGSIARRDGWEFELKTD